jgi:hypothetical protein
MTAPRFAFSDSKERFDAIRLPLTRVLFFPQLFGGHGFNLKVAPDIPFDKW